MELHGKNGFGSHELLTTVEEDALILYKYFEVLSKLPEAINSSNLNSNVKLSKNAFRDLTHVMEQYVGKNRRVTAEQIATMIDFCNLLNTFPFSLKHDGNYDNQPNHFTDERRDIMRDCVKVHFENKKMTLKTIQQRARDAYNKKQPVKATQNRKPKNEVREALDNGLFDLNASSK